MISASQNNFTFMKKLFLRIGWMLLVVWASLTITFVLSRVIPADPARLAAGLEAGPEQVEEVRKLLGLNKPMFTQYIDYLVKIIHFDLGTSIQTRQPVIDDVYRYLPATLELVFFTFALYVLLSIFLGVLWAMFPRGIFAKVMHTLTILGSSMPVFWIALNFQLYFAGKLHWFPLAGNLDYGNLNIARVTGVGTLDALIATDFLGLKTALLTLVLPVTSLLITVLPIATRLTKTMVELEIEQPYIRTSRSRGTKEARIFFSDALKNSLNPVITIMGMQFGWLLGGTILVEVVFSWPGLGLYAFDAFRTFDYNPILAITLIVTVTFVLVNEIVGFIYPILDPRLRKKS
jgi:peptide/nickel transport system permease protein